MIYIFVFKIQKIMFCIGINNKIVIKVYINIKIRLFRKHLKYFLRL